MLNDHLVSIQERPPGPHETPVRVVIQMLLHLTACNGSASGCPDNVDASHSLVHCSDNGKESYTP